MWSHDRHACRFFWPKRSWARSVNIKWSTHATIRFYIVLTLTLCVDDLLPKRCHVKNKDVVRTKSWQLAFLQASQCDCVQKVSVWIFRTASFCHVPWTAVLPQSEEAVQKCDVAQLGSTCVSVIPIRIVRRNPIDGILKFTCKSRLPSSFESQVPLRMVDTSGREMSITTVWSDCFDVTFVFVYKRFDQSVSEFKLKFSMNALCTLIVDWHVQFVIDSARVGKLECEVVHDHCFCLWRVLTMIASD